VLPQLARDPLATCQQARERFGDVVRLPVINGSVYLLVHPDHVEQVLVSQNTNHWKGRLFSRADFLFGNGLVLSDGEDWRQHRRIMNPGFSGGRLQAAVGAMLDVIEDQAERWRQAERDHRAVDIESEMTTLTLDLMATAMLGVRLSQHELEITGRAFAVVLNHLGLRFATFTLPPSVRLPGEARARRALATLDTMADRIVERQTKARDDVLGYLLAAWQGGDITRRQVRDEVITLLFGGYEATAHALSWTWYLLDQNPEVGDKVREEAAAATPGDPSALVYTGQVIDEVLRLYPSFWMVLRSSYEEATIGGYTVPGGAPILLVPWLTHRLPEFWADPLSFKPGRWAGWQPAHRCAYFPFGAGQRLCIGRPLALLEMQLAVSTLSRQFRPRVLGDQPVPVRARSTLQPRRGIRMILDRA
jgi:enediyne biosynthesis protein E7